MANKLQQAARAKKAKHVPETGSDLWERGQQHDEPLPAYTSLLYMGMKDLKRHVAEIEEYLGGDSSIVTMEEMRLRLSSAEQKIADLTKRLDDALKEVE